MVVEHIQPHQMIEQAHDYHHYEHSLPSNNIDLDLTQNMIFMGYI
jgi:hypothetical protein